MLASLHLLIALLVGLTGPRAESLAPANAKPELALSPRNASYEMEVRLDPATHLLHGTQVLTWRNPTKRSTQELRYHLYYNAWRNSDSSWFRHREQQGRPAASSADAQWAYSDVEELVLLGEDGEHDLWPSAEFVAPDDGNLADRTVLRVPLPAVLEPGQSVRVRLKWTAKVPRTVARTGVRGDYYFLAQWFPKVGVFEDSGSWNCHQFVQTEFFADFGVYEVRLRVPQYWVVGATGKLKQVTMHADGSATHLYVQDDVHDFAWTTAPDSLVHQRKFASEGLPEVDMRVLLRPEHADFADRYFTATAAALEHYGKWWGAYPYDHITIVDPAYGSGTGGMEYPTLFTGGARWLSPPATRSPEGVSVHEAGHQFWYGLVANNEFEHAWLDEGFNTYSTSRTMKAAFGPPVHSTRYMEGFLPVVFSDLVRAERGDGADQYRGMTSALTRDPQATPSYLTGPGGYRVNAYAKGALTLRTLENYLGWPTFQQVMSTYFARYRFAHPRPIDFFRVAERVSGQDLDWFWKQVHHDTAVFDYGVGRVASSPVREVKGFVDGPEGPALQRATPGAAEPKGPTAPGATASGATQQRSTVFVRRFGSGVFPVLVDVSFSDGSRVVEHWDGQQRWVKFQYQREAAVSRVRVDPEAQLVLDVDRTNNSWVDKPRADQAATKWASRWMFWVQSSMEAMAFFS